MSKAEEYRNKNLHLKDFSNYLSESELALIDSALTDFHKEQIEGIRDEIKKRIGLHEKNQMWNTAKAERGILELLKRIEHDNGI